MTALAMTAASLAALVHVLFFLMESVWFHRPAVHRRFGASAAEAGVLRPMAFNQGFYNLMLALGAVVGVVALGRDAEVVGRTLIAFTCATMLVAGLVLLLTDRRFLPASLLQALPPLVALGALAPW